MPTATATPVRMPQLGESVTEGTIGAWLRSPGDVIEKYDPLVEVESDKASSELPAPIAGTLVEILVEPGTTVPVGTTLCTIAEGGAVVVAPDQSQSSAANGRHDNDEELSRLRARSSPFVRRTAEEFGIDLATISGSGVGGRVTKQDVLAAVAAQSSQSAPGATVPTPPATPSPTPQPTPSAEPTRQTRPKVAPVARPLERGLGDTLVPLTPMRRAIAANMVTSVQTAPHATCVMEVDMTGAVRWRSEIQETFSAREGIDLTYLPLALRAVSVALREHPRLNAVWTDDGIVQRGEINLGVAVALDDGLVVPVIRNADRLGIAGLAHALSELTTRARSGAFTADDFAGGTFTVNNPGTLGSIMSTPILVQPQVAIISTEAIVKRPVVVDDMIAVRSMMNLSLTIDHRALDGLMATRFLKSVKDWLEAVTPGMPV